MTRFSLILFLIFPILAVCQVVSESYVEKKLNEASQYYQQSNYESAIKTLDALYSQSLKEKNRYGAGMALAKKIYYQTEKGDFVNTEPDWNALESFSSKNKTQDIILKMNILKTKAEFYSQKEEYQKATAYLDEGIRLSGNSSQTAYITAELYYLYGKIKLKNSQHIEANQYILKAIRIYEKLGDDESASLLYGDLANNSFLMGEKERAIDYAKKGIEALKKYKDYENLYTQLSNLGRMYQTSGDTENAIKYFTESAEYAEKSVRKETKFNSQVNLALVYHSKKDRENALKYMNIAIEEGRKINQPKLHRYIRTGAMFAGYTGNEELMNKYYDESYEMAVRAKDKEALRDWYSSQNFYYVNVKKDPAKAYPFLEKFHAYKDSIINEKSKKDFNELEVQYQTEKKQSEIDKLSIEKKIQTLEIERKNALIKGNILEANEKQKEIELLTKTKEINNLKITKQNETLSLNEVQIKYLQQQKKLSEQENLLKENKIRNEKLTRNLIIASFAAALLVFAFLINRMILKKKIDQKNMLLKERSRISSELHDEVGSTLTAINLLSHSAINNVSKENSAREKIEKIRDNTQNVMENISDIVWSMNPENENFSQMKIKMIEFAETVLENNNISYTFEAENNLNDIKLNAEKRRDFYLIFKEAVNNLSKYSEANVAEIQIRKSGNLLKMMIKDNGTGFNETLVKQGNGLRNMKKRAERNGGNLDIKSGKSGTSISLNFPYA